MVEERFDKLSTEPAVRERSEKLPTCPSGYILAYSAERGYYCKREAEIVEPPGIITPPPEVEAPYQPPGIAPAVVLPPPVAPPEIDLPTTLEYLYPEMFEPDVSFGISAEDLPSVILENLRTWATEEPETFLSDLYERTTPEQAQALMESMGLVLEAPPIEETIATLFPDKTLEEFSAFVEEDWGGFLETMQVGGRTVEKETLLKAMGYSDADIEKFFPETRWWTLRFWLETFFTPYGGEDLKGKAAASYIAGVGDVVSSTAGVARWLGYEDAGEVLSSIGTPLQNVAPPPMLGEFEFSHLLDPEWYATSVIRALPFALSLAPLAIGGYMGGAAIATAAGIGRIGAWLIGSFAGTALSRPLESAFEAGNAYDNAIAMGMTEKEADEAATNVFIDNMKLAGMDAFQIAIALAPTPKWVPSSLVRSGLVRTVRIGGKMVIVGLTEGGEEVYQDMVQRRALGEEWQLDPQAKEVFAIGMAMGMGMGLGGDIIASVINKSKAEMTPDIRKDFDKSVSDFERQGFRTEQAELRALDVIARTPEGEKIVSEAIKEVKEEAIRVPVPEVVPAVPEAPLIEALIREGDELVTMAEAIEPENASVIEFRGLVSQAKEATTIEAQRRVLTQMEALEDEVRAIAKVPKPPAVEVAKPEVFMTEEMWGEMPETARAKALASAGLNRNLASKSWADLTTNQKQALTGEIVEVKPLAVKAPPPLEVPERTVYSEGGVPVSPDEPIAQDVVDNISILQDIGALERVRPTRKVFERLGLYETYKGIQKAEVELGEAKAAFTKKLKEMSKLVDKERRHLVFRELENPGSQVGLTFNEKRVVSFFRENFNRWADTLNIPQEKRVKNYVTHIFEADIAEQLKEKHPLDPAIARALEYRAPKTIFNPFLQKRLGATVGLMEDPFVAASAYESRQLNVLYYEPFVQKIAAIANDPNQPRSVRDYLKDYSRRMTGIPSKLDLEINTTLQELAGKLRGLPGGEAIANFLTRGNPSGWAAYNYTSAIYTLWLGFKPTSAIRNLSQHTLIIGEVGPVNFADGLRMRFTKEGKAALAESLVLRSRKAAFVPGIDDSFTTQWVDKFRETALWMFRAADKQNVSDAFLGGYVEAKRLLPDADRQVWLDRGDEVAADTQYLYTRMNSMAISQSSLGRIFSILTTWSENWMELMTKWVSKRPSQVYLQYERATGVKATKAAWSTSYKAILMYMIIIGIGFAVKEHTRLKAWEYTGLTSIRYLADIASGDFPGLQYIGAAANLIAGFVTDDDRRFNEGLSQLNPIKMAGIVRQIEAVATGDKDWLTLLLYLEGRDWKLKQRKDKWEKGWKDYEALETTKERDKYREDNPLIEAQMFITSKFTTLTTDEARDEVLRLIEKHDLEVEFIDGYDKVFGIDTDEKFTASKKLLGTVELDEEGKQKLLESGELDYYTTSNFASDVNALVKVAGRYKVEKDGNPLAVEYLRAKDLFVQYESLTEDDARVLFRQQFPDVEAQLYLWGKIASFKNPKSAEILLRLMEKYNIPPESVPAFLDNPERYDELFTPVFEMKQRWFDLDTEYENYGNPESPLYIEDDDARDEARAKLKTDNPKWVDDMRRIEAIENDGADFAEGWVERGHTTDEFGAGSSEAKVWLLDNKDAWDWALEQKLLTDDGSDWNERVLRLNVEFAKQDEVYDALETDEARDAYLEANMGYHIGKRRRDALNMGFPEAQMNSYIYWYTNPTIVKPDNWEEKTKTDLWYEDDWYLMKNKEFYNTMVNMGVWGKKDFSKVPTEKVFLKYRDYLKLPVGSQRSIFRWDNLDLDAWLVKKFGYVPIKEKLEKKPVVEEKELTELEESLAEMQAALAELK